jgi:chromosome segregation ATPase
VAIEQAMYFALGFLLAALCMLMFLPAFWRRAMRLSMRRLQMLAPLTQEQAVAERDLLRADFALRERQNAQEMEQVRAEKAKDLLDIGQKSARIFELDEKLRKAENHGRELERRLNETKTTLEERSSLLDSTEMALHEMTTRVERLLGNLRSANASYEEFDRETKAEHDRLVATHSAKVGAVHQENAELRGVLEELQRAHAKLTEEAARLSESHAELERLKPEHVANVAARTALQQELEALRAATGEEIDRKTNQIAHLENALRHARAEARDNADKLETARADASMLHGAVNALREERERVRALPVDGQGLSEADIASLREELVSMGARVLEAAEKQKS